MIPYRVQAPYDWQSLLALIQTAFAHMDGRIDPPSSMHALTEADLARQSTKAEIWAISPDPKALPVACVVLTPKAHALYVGYFGSLLVAMVTRVTQGHSGRPLQLGTVAAIAFVLIQCVAVLRIVAELVPDRMLWQAIAACAWLLAFLPWVLRSVFIYTTPRADAKPG